MGGAQFAKIVPYLANPLVLVGFCLFLLFGTHRVLLKRGFLSPLSKRQSSIVVRMILNHGLWISIVIMVFGFGYAGFRTYQQTKNAPGQTPSIKQQTGACGSNIAGDNNQATVTCEDKKAEPNENPK
jgi:hypothetical protein